MGTAIEQTTSTRCKYSWTHSLSFRAEAASDVKSRSFKKHVNSLPNSLKHAWLLALQTSMCEQTQRVFIAPTRTCRRIHTHTLQQMVLIQWGMYAEKCLCLTQIPWRLSLRCGMLFLSWDLRVWARLPERWSSACQRADFSPLCIWLPWLSAATYPNSRWEMFLFQYVHVCVWASFCSCESDFINGWWSCLPLGLCPPAV